MVKEEALDVESDGFRLNAGIALPDDPRGLVLLLHGIPTTAPPDPTDEGYPGLARTFAARRWATVWVEMRGVRSSEGFFSLEGWVRDVGAALAAARSVEGVGTLPAAIVASSGGGVVAVEVARRGTPLDALVLLGVPAAWGSFAEDAAEGIHRITVDAGMKVAPEVLEDPGSWVAEFESIVAEEAVGDVDLPILVLHGGADDIVPVSHAARIAERARRAEMKILEGSGHQLRRDPDAIRITLDWLERVL